MNTGSAGMTNPHRERFVIIPKSAIERSSSFLAIVNVVQTRRNAILCHTLFADLRGYDQKSTGVDGERRRNKTE